MLGLSECKSALVLCVTQFLSELLISLSQVTYLSKVSLSRGVELLLEHLESRLRLTLLIRGLTVFVKSFDHLLVLPL